MKIHHHNTEPPIYHCDHCGRDTRATDEYPEINEHSNSLEGHVQMQGCYGSTRYDFTLVKAELCEDCMHRVLVWIDGGSGRGAQHINMLEADQAFTSEYSGRPASGIIRPTSKRTRAAFRGWIERRYRIALLRPTDE